MCLILASWKDLEIITGLFHQTVKNIAPVSNVTLIWQKRDLPLGPFWDLRSS